MKFVQNSALPEVDVELPTGKWVFSNFNKKNVIWETNYTMFHYSLRVIDEPKMSKSNFVLVPTVGRYLRKAALKNNSVHRRRVKWLCLRCRDCSHCQTIWCNRPLNLSKNVETLNHSTWPPESVVFSSHDKLDGRREEGGDEKQWTAEEFWEIQNGGLLLRFPFFGNFRDYNHGNVYTWYSHRFKHKPKRGCCLSWLCLCWWCIHADSWNQPDWKVSKETVKFIESEYGSRAKQALAILEWFLWFRQERSNIWRERPTLSLYPNAIGKRLSLICQTYMYDCMRTNIGSLPRHTLGIVISIICNIDNWFNINHFNVCCQTMKIDTLI